MSLTIENNILMKNGKPFFYLADTCWSAFTNIKDNDWYLKGKYYVTLEDTNMLILKQEISKEEQTIIYYKRS